jgi:hypothetical protein
VLREHAPERGFSRAAQADQRDPPPAVGAARERDARLDYLRERRPFALRHLRDEIDDTAERSAAAGCISPPRSKVFRRPRNFLRSKKPRLFSLYSRNRNGPAYR